MMKVQQIETLLLQEMEEVRGGLAGSCGCKSGAKQSGESGGTCSCETGAGQRNLGSQVEPKPSTCSCDTGAAQ